MTEPGGWYYMRARYYDPVAGRFISEDPLGFDGGDVNLYAYCLNNPVNLVDPMGLWGIDYGGTLMGADFSATLYDSKKGWFPSTETNLGVSTTAVGGGIKINFDDPCERSNNNDSDLMVSWGLSKYLGISYNPDFSRKSVNIGVGLGLHLPKKLELGLSHIFQVIPCLLTVSRRFPAVG